MTRHANVELLSSYLDAELNGSETAAVEEHLGSCEQCRRRLEGMRRVVARLAGLERAAPPSHLGRLVERRVRLESGRPTLLRSIELALGRMPLQSTLAPLFALVLALAVIIYLFAYGLDRDRAAGTRVILNPEVRAVVESRQIEGRTFDRTGDTWVERGLVADEDVRVVDLRPGSGEPAIANRGDLEPFAQLGGRVRLQLAEEVIEVVFEQPVAD